MQLDPQMKAILDQAAAAGAQPFHTMTPAQARAAIDTMFQAFRGQPKEVAKSEDRKVPGPAGDIPVRIYTPAGNGPLGALVYFHGGGWVIGNIETHDVTCCELAHDTPCVTVSVDYRLAPEHKFPAGPEDCYAATKWAAEHARELNADPRRVVIVGDSAGGNMVAVTALMIRDKGGPALRGQLMIYPVTDYFNSGHPSYTENAEGYGLTAAGMRWCWAKYLNRESEADNNFLSPLR